MSKHQVGHDHQWQEATGGDVEATCPCGAWKKAGAIVEVVYPGTPEWEESERALEQQRRRGE